MPRKRNRRMLYSRLRGYAAYGNMNLAGADEAYSSSASGLMRLSARTREKHVTAPRGRIPAQWRGRKPAPFRDVSKDDVQKRRRRDECDVQYARSRDARTRRIARIAAHRARAVRAREGARDGRGRAARSLFDRLLRSNG